MQEFTISRIQASQEFKNFKNSSLGVFKNTEIQEFENEKDEIELGQWDQQEKKNDQLKWKADYLSSLAEYADNNCDKFEDVFDYADIDDLKEEAKRVNEFLKNK